MPATFNTIELEFIVVDAAGNQIPNVVVTQPDAASRQHFAKAAEVVVFPLDVLNQAPNTEVPIVGAQATYKPDPTEPNDANVLSGFDLDAPVTILAASSGQVNVKAKMANVAQLGKRGKYVVLLVAA